MNNMATINECDSIYSNFLESIQNHFNSVTGNKPLFTTDATNLFQMFLDAFPEEHRQYHNCHSCRRFVELYGNLVSINEDGQTIPALWGEAEGIYAKPIAAVRKLVAKARVTGVFYSSHDVWGLPVTGNWTHMSVKPTSKFIHKSSSLLSNEQVMAEKREEYAMLQRGLAEFKREHVETALGILDTDTLYRSEKVMGPAKWLLELHKIRDTVKGKARDNVTWLAVARAPVGFCHVRTTMIGTLLEDIAAGLSVADISRKFKEKMNPLQYQRPQSSPSDSNIEQAEKVIASLNSASGFARRYARLDDIVPLWKPVPVKEKEDGGSLFGHLKSENKKNNKITEVNASIDITWDKFKRTVLPSAEKIEFSVPHVATYIALVTAENKDAPPIIQWDSEELRNPVSWYVYNQRTPSTRWNLNDGSFVPVTAITYLPHMWYNEEKFSHHGAGVVLILEGCKDKFLTDGIALFPELLKSEYHSIRKTIEAFSRSQVMGGREDANACGVDLRKGNIWNYEVRVTTRNGMQVTTYKLDRWD